MLRVITYSERNVQVAPPVAPIVCAAATSTPVFQSTQFVRGEVASRYIQNIGDNECYYTVGQMSGDPQVPSCTPQAFHGVIPSKQQLDVTATRQCVAVYSVLGTTITVAIALRNDLGH